MSSNLKVNSLVPATGTEIGIGTTGGSIDFRCPATFGGNVTIGGTLTYDEVINIDSIGVITARSNIDCNGSLDVDGHTNLDNVSVAGVSTFAGAISASTLTASSSIAAASLTASSSYPTVTLNDTDSENDYQLRNANGTFAIHDLDASANRLTINSSGVIDFNGNVEANFDLDVDGHTNLDNVSVSGVSTFSGVVRVPNGSAAAPAIHFGDSDTGLYGDASNGVRLTAGGSDKIVATTNGVTFPIKATALTSFTLGSQSALSKPLYFADAASVESASILLDNSSQELRIKNGRFSGEITFTTYNVERLRIKANGVIQFNGTNSSDNTNKLVYLTTPSYDTDEEPFGFIHSGTYSNQNSVSYTHLTLPTKA